MSGKTHPSHVVIGKLELSVRCDRCGKFAAYETGQTLERWNRELRTFIEKHMACPPKKS